MELSIQLIKSFIPKRKFCDCTKLNGISLKQNSYDLFYSDYYKEFILRTSTFNEKLIKILRENFNIIYVKHFFMHYDEFVIKQKQ